MSCGKQEIINLGSLFMLEKNTSTFFLIESCVPPWSYLISWSLFRHQERFLSKSLPHVNTLSWKLINPSCECFQPLQGRQQNSNENPSYKVWDNTIDKHFQSTQRPHLTFLVVSCVVLYSLPGWRTCLAQIKQITYAAGLDCSATLDKEAHILCIQKCCFP